METFNIRFFSTWMNRVFLEIKLLKVGCEQLSYSDFYLILGYLSRARWSLFRKLNVFRNILKKICLIKVASNYKQKNIIIDEGMSHLPIIFSTSLANFPELVFQKFMTSYPATVIVVQARENIVKQRIMKRGHHFTKSQEILDHFVKLNYSALRFQRNLLLQYNNVSLISLDEHKF